MRTRSHGMYSIQRKIMNLSSLLSKGHMWTNQSQEVKQVRKRMKESTMWSKCVEILFQTSKVVKKERGGGEGHEGETNYSTYATINFLWLEDKYILA